MWNDDLCVVEILAFVDLAQVTSLFSVTSKFSYTEFQKSFFTIHAENIRVFDISYHVRTYIAITGGTSRAQWEDVTGSTPLTFINDCVSFTTTVSARFWLMDCRNVADASKMATELYREAIHVPFMAK